MLRWGEDYFKSKDFEYPKREIELMLCDLFDYKRIDLYTHFEDHLSPAQLATLKSWIPRRVKHEPIQYITGKSEFYGHPLIVTPDVLIPRPETERLVDVALHAIGNIEAPRVLDIGTGSGCIAIAVAAECPQAQVTALDISAAALKVAKQNSNLNKLNNISFERIDIMQALPDGSFDIVISNPPYIPTMEMETIMEEVRHYEPRAALTDDRDGLSFYKHFAAIASRIIKPGGWLIVEIGTGDHPLFVQSIFNDAGFTDLELFSDYNGDHRVLKISI